MNWLRKKCGSQEEFPFVDDQGKEALNFNISITIYGIICGILYLIFIGMILAVVVALFHLVFSIIAAIKASEGKKFTYPLTIRLIR